MADVKEKGPADAAPKKANIELKKWNAVALWAWGACNIWDKDVNYYLDLHFFFEMCDPYTTYP
mgnify:CR=1 FL=1